MKIKVEYTKSEEPLTMLGNKLFTSEQIKEIRSIK